MQTGKDMKSFKDYSWRLKSFFTKIFGGMKPKKFFQYYHELHNDSPY